MIYFFYGEDRDKARAKWRAAIAVFQKKYPEGLVFKFSAEEFDQSKFEELMHSGDLFGEKRLIAASSLFENKEAEEFVEKNLAALASSPNTFLHLEAQLPSELIKKIEKAGGKAEEYKLALQSAAPPFNIFAVNDAFITRDRKQLWLVYQKALVAGIPEEEIFWKLVWQVKTMLLVAKEGSENLKTIKPFVAGKAKRGLAKFKVEELEKLSGDLVALWHDTRRGLGDFDIGLEQLVLSI